MALTNNLRGFARERRWKVQDWVSLHINASVEFSPVQVGEMMLDPFFNVNTPGRTCSGGLVR